MKTTRRFRVDVQHADGSWKPARQGWPVTKAMWLTGAMPVPFQDAEKSERTAELIRKSGLFASVVEVFP